MDVSPILDPLNDAQREAVTAPLGNLLVLAGAGSGKTRVLVHRIAWLLAAESASPWSILAVTFTNKAAREMRYRIENLLGQPLGGMWVGTFHGLAHRLLRGHWKEAGLPQGFQILDSDDQFRLIKRLLKNLDLDEARWPPRQIQWFINGRKDEGLRAHHLDDGGDPYQRQMIRLYSEYQNACDRGGQVDFAELLLRAHELWRERPDILQHYQQRFQHILVDEFQDTNAIQYAWLRMLAGPRNNLFVVGDDDQSIYGWRGARVENIQSFQTHYEHAILVRLEQNYRSTGNILNAANALINNNPSRLGKQLWTQDGDGEPIKLYAAFNEIDEARFVVERIRQFIDEGNNQSEAAILYRTTAQSRLFEEALIQAAIPYRVYGGLRFFERAEIKDALAYLRLLSNQQDDGAFERAVNMPPRGIGPKTMDAVRAHARDFDCSLWQASSALLRGGAMPKRAATALQGFLDLVEELRVNCANLSLPEQVEQMLTASGLPDHFDKSRDGKGIDRKENLEELVNATRQFGYEVDETEEMDELSAFLSHAALEAGEAQGDPSESCVQLMTLHSAKGLEFPLVFLVGMEEGLFPHSMSADDPDRLEEERRLCYVGVTRAMRELYLCHAESRRLHGSDSYPLPSRFIREMPAELMSEVRAGPGIGQPLYGRAPYLEVAEQSGFSLGQRVRHAKFGEGVVLNAEGQGRSARVQVNFEEVGSKWLVVAYANLLPC
ncbi:MAG: DNA helicase II [gamma proteobacterium symbiont of Ctena orbiculata]|uniref:DNA 3'-5' helicase n=1 Tax=Candidatus Thiodiazotropha taylori TaxID=2792791 RepID=A0A944M8L2_9GAMM|nr:DNA helicase II [Candidatus Thiodiazotropha taylori]PVV11143.1 MAG: DNA helicase II [gamma proteobacterium symbiont of Ctena orbiculata]MBT2987353.1 DNA helicase II [Candidatus Thiodiazotropha taylori]MBT2995392.1 DNA helicase II [Candidatus Thiodiazotropha taylori]MBT3001852.1 DNA helicase II [Candidatus Thiodiazotropha taylori]